MIVKVYRHVHVGCFHNFSNHCRKTRTYTLYALSMTYCLTVEPFTADTIVSLIQGVVLYRITGHKKVSIFGVVCIEGFHYSIGFQLMFRTLKVPSNK